MLVTSSWHLEDDKMIEEREDNWMEQVQGKEFVQRGTFWFNKSLILLQPNICISLSA